jgi:hypothetical protein
MNNAHSVLSFVYQKNYFSVVWHQKLLYDTKSCCTTAKVVVWQQKLLYDSKSCCTTAKAVVPTLAYNYKVV